ncbi:hypothetical protein TWF696_008499 [Orbilia brochopaga]|uniref:HIT domain-containing protein n=1 Tax=Orbilia brochopaga TaxID=3140254 RepID=A0AAV9UFV7_9PEZI
MASQSPAAEPTDPDCLFCKGGFVVTAELYRDEDMVVIDDIHPSGRTHWLIMPLQHIRSVEALTAAHLPLYRKMLAVRDQLVLEHHPDITPATRHRVRSGFHRGSRKINVVGPLKFTLPEVISVKHLHMHVITDLNTNIGYLKYPLWNPLIFITAEEVLKRLESEEKAVNGGPADGSQSHTEL